MGKAVQAWLRSDFMHMCEERAGSLVECLTQDQGVAGSSLTGSTVLCPCARHFITCLVLVQPKTIRPDMPEKLLTGM